MPHLEKITLKPDKYPTREKYPFNLKLFQHTKNLEFDSPVTFFVGENGSGKSTLLRAICRKCDIHIWEGERRARYEKNPFEEKLSEYIEISWINGKVPGSFFGSDIFRNFAQVLDEWAAADPGMLKYFGGQSLMTQSHGQSLMSFFRNRYKIRGIYLLDEPETALSPGTQLELLKVLSSASSDGAAQFIIATHSPILLACPGAKILSFDHTPVKQVDYEDTDHFRVYRDFMADRDRFLTS